MKSVLIFGTAAALANFDQVSSAASLRRYKRAPPSWSEWSEWNRKCPEYTRRRYGSYKIRRERRRKCPGGRGCSGESYQGFICAPYMDNVAYETTTSAPATRRPYYTTTRKQTSVPEKKVVCGVLKPSRSSSLQSPRVNLNIMRIMSNTISEVHSIEEVPWMARLGKNSTDRSEDLVCGCSIISGKYAVSAAHCFCMNGYSSTVNNCEKLKRMNEFPKITKQAKEYWLEVGHLELNKGQIFQPESVLLHDLWSGNAANAYDIAIITTKSNMLTNAEAVPICLPQPQQCYLDKTKLSVAGWGYHNKAGGRVVSGKASTVLRRTELELMDFRSCRNKISSLHSVLCATSDEITDVCTGDSGGGLYVKDLDQHFLYGVVSFGDRCDYSINRRKAPIGRYTRVTSHLNWIHKNTPGLDDNVVQYPDERAQETFETKWPMHSGLCIGSNPTKDSSNWYLAALQARCPDPKGNCRS